MCRLLLIALASFWLSGCFVFEEIRKGNELMDSHASPARRKKAADAASQAEADVANAAKSGAPIEWAKAKDRLSEWWHEAIEEDPIEPDPDDHIISCEINGKVRFTRKSQCELGGGRTTGVYSSSKKDP
jgi:hypothetical protein